MKNLMLGFVLLISIMSFGQLKKVESPILETKVGPMGQFWAGASYYNDYVIITFKDAKYTTITVLKTFVLNKKDFEDLYNLLTSETNKKDDFYEMTTMDKGTLYIKYDKMLGVVYPIIMLSDKGVNSMFPNLNKKQFKKLFNKNN